MIRVPVSCADPSRDQRERFRVLQFATTGAVLLLLTSFALTAQSRISRNGAQRMEVTLERHQDGAWKIIEPGLVLDRNDRVRFRFKANFSGYLYVTNQSTSERTTLLFPRQDTGSNHRIVANREYVIPSTAQGAFRVDGPEGYDVVSWLVSPVELGRPEAPSAPAPQGRLVPRCDDAIFRARGACVDSAAGPQAAQRDEKDQVLVIREKQSSVIASAEPLKGPMVYEFHLAHR
jgi:hypothetical protein